jgi:DNA-binding NarL/FixJ family response regulator
MESSKHGNAEPFDAAIIIHESLFERLKFVQQISAACQDFNLICCPGDLAELMACCRGLDACVLIVESAVLLKATPVQVGELLRRGTSLRVLARVDGEDAAQLKDLIMLGCFGFLTDDTTLPWLKKILEAIGCGEMWVPRSLLSQIFRAELVEHNLSRLSRRECEIMSLLGQGLTNKVIAERLFISQETLRWHLRNLYGKTRVQGRDKLIRYANDLNDVALVPEDKASTPANTQSSKARRCS